MYCLTIDRRIPIDQAWELLENAGIQMGYSDEDEQQANIYVFADSPDLFAGFDWISRFEPYELPEIDWEAQWEAHGLDYRDGFVNLDLTKFGRAVESLKLEPGPGFGDLSHPTTRLVLQLLALHLDKEPVIDIGCGSGVLALAAVAMGAPVAYGIDIDPDALVHSRKNAEINRMSAACHFCLPHEMQLNEPLQNWLLLMNMIQSEQQVAWESLPLLHRLHGTLLTSGIRAEDKEAYLSLTAHWGWHLKKEIEEEGWLAFEFSL